MKKLKTFLPVLILCVLVFGLNSCRTDTTKEKLTAEFSIDRGQVVVGDSLRFINGSKNFSKIIWDFGDGESSEKKDPLHAYKSAGTFYPKIIVTKGSQKLEFELKIVVEALPFVVIEISDTLMVVGKEILFKTNENSIVIWKVNDAVLPESEFLKNTFTEPGSYKIEIVHPITKRLLDQKTIEVKLQPDGPPIPPQPDKPVIVKKPPITITVVPTTVFAGDKISYSTNSDSIEWDFGGKATSQAPAGEVFFDDIGEYIIKLTNRTTGKVVKTKTITVLEKVDDNRFSSWLTSIANKGLSDKDLTDKERRDLTIKVSGNCINNGDKVPFTGDQGGDFMDFVRKIYIQANPFEQVNIEVKIQLNTNRKVTSVQLVTYDKKTIDK